MTPFFSIISIKTNSFSDEKLAVGLIVVTDKVYFNYSKNKLELLKKIDVSNTLFYLAKNNLEKIHSDVIAKNKSLALNLISDIFSVDYFEYLHQYTAGTILFSKPTILNIQFDHTTFESYYEKFIGENFKREKQSSRTNLKKKVKQLFTKEIGNKVDLEYTLKPNRFSGLLKDFNLSMITVNGVVTSAQVIDSNISINYLAGNMYELQNVFESLIEKGKQLNKKAEKIKLIFENPESTENQKWFNKLYQEKKDIFEFTKYEDINDIVNTISKSEKYQKFSEIIISDEN